MTRVPRGPDPSRARARDLGLAPGALPPGPANAITDVQGIRVGHSTLIAGNDLRTGVTAIVHDALIGRDQAGRRSLPAGLAVFNGFGKMTGATQIAEVGTVETPILLTSTLSVFLVADAVLSYLHRQPALADVGTLNPVVAETNDGYLSDIWARPITAEHVRAAIDGAASGSVAEGCVGAGTGTRALGFKAGIGTSSRRAAMTNGATITVGALVQANFGGILTIAGVPVSAPVDTGTSGPEPTGNSCVVVLATDAALDSRQLERLANRAFPAMARTGSNFSGHSGDYALAVSTAAGRRAENGDHHVPGKDLDVLFTAATEATEEAILNSLFMAVTTTGFGGHVAHAVPLHDVLDLVSGRSASPSAS